LALTALCAVRGRAGGAAPAEARLSPEASSAFDRYVQLTEARIAAELRPGGAFLRPDALPAMERESAYAAVRDGELRIERLETLDNGQAVKCPGGMIHHWTGIVFIPGATLDQVLKVVQDYDDHAEIYAPEVVRSRILWHMGDAFHIYMRLMQKKVITVVLDTEHDAHFERLDAVRVASRSISTRVQQVEDAGEPAEHDLPAGQDGGYLWRINSYWRFAERDGGVYVQSESVSLTRSIPAGLGWIVGPFVESVPRELLRQTLESTRQGVERFAKPPAARRSGR